MKLNIYKSTSFKSEMKKITMFVVCVMSIIQLAAGGFEIPGPFENADPSYQMALDTVPIKDRTGDFLNNGSENPFDLNTSLITQEVEYDPESGNYILTEKIGDEYYRMPTYMTFSEYMDWKAKQQQQDFFNKMNGIDSGSRGTSGKIDPISNVNIQRNLVDRLFGGNGITIKPKGNIDLTLLGYYQETLNPSIPRRSQVQWGPDFKMDIKMSVEGNIGDKMNLNFNFNTASTFNFDDKVKLAYDSEQWSEDEIIKKVEAGNVSLPLRSSLIQGGQNLFGIKVESQWGKLRLTTIASQKTSTQEELTIQSGGLAQEFEVRPDEYDANRHFFISNFNRNTYEKALSNLPQITTPFRITKMQVWVTNDRNETDGLRNIIALADLGVGNEGDLTNPDAINVSPTDPTYTDYTGNYTLPDNSVNNLYDEIVNDESARDQTTASTVLSTKYGLTQTKDFEVLKARQLQPSEFTYHPELGFISLNIRLRANQVLAVSYQYSYSYNGSEVYQVGEMANDVNYELPPKNLFTRLLKNTTQNVDEPNWDLMMKNVYSIGASQVDRESFKFDIFYEDNSDGSLKRYIPREGFFNKPLLDVFNLDKLNIYNDPQQDGIFDYVEGVTFNTRTGSVIFPVLEPFGSSLTDLFGDPVLAEEFSYQDLYDKTKFQAQERLERNRFVMKGEFKSSVSSEISLGAWNIPEGSVTVRAGSQTLREGIDYEINYGIGQIRIINDAYLQQGVPIRVSYEDNSLFSLNQKGMLGARADYEFNKNLNLGATYMHLFERPYTEKVNIGDDPINNRIVGLDINYNNEVPWVTRALDRLPIYSTKVPSSLSFNAEVAALKPSHARAINGDDDNGGIIMLDDFEGASSAIPLGIQTNQWILASVPGGRPDMFPEAELTNDLTYGYNRAMLNWYIMERSGVRNQEDENDPMTRTIDLDELFPNKVVQPGLLNDILTFDMTYYPDERGPYNFDPPNGSNYSQGSFWDNEEKKMKLKEPETRWGGIMRYLNNTNFEQANVEFLEFWMLNPYTETNRSEHLPDEAGSIFFNLGNVSEDVLRDNLQFYENAVNVDPNAQAQIPTQNTVWGEVPLSSPKVNGFDQNNREIQDIGLDGLEDGQEREFYRDYIEAVLATNPLAEVRDDPSNDNFADFLDESIFPNGTSVLERYSRFNGPQGNAPNPQTNRIQRGNPQPDAEDLNNNRSLDQGESYYEYEVKLFNQNGEIDEDAAKYVTESRVLDKDKSRWYRFRIPLSDGVAVNGIQGFQSIQFIRMYMKGFTTQKTFRMADFQLIRNQWRRYVPNCGDGINPVDFSVDKVSIEENSSRLPFNYVLPPGIKRERVQTSYAQLPQDERSMALNFKNLVNDNLNEFCEASIIKLTTVDLRVFEKLQMFIHAESAQDIPEGDLSVFIRIGKDFTDNFYEYVIPIKQSDPDQPGSVNDPSAIWLTENMLDINLSDFTDVKKLRNIEGADFQEIFPAQSVPDPEKRAYIKGNPSLGYIKGIQIGVRNSSDTNTPLEGSVWVNELRMSGLDERGGVAGLARMDLQMADLGNLTLSGSFNTIGFGALDQKLDARSKENVREYDIATNLELGKFLPTNFRINLPFYAQYANVTSTPQFDPYDLDLTVKEKIAAQPELKDEILDLAVDQTTIKTLNLTNVRKQRNPENTRKPMPWDISNFSASYAITEIEKKDPIIQSDQTSDQRGALDYNYSRNVKYIEPFKGVSNKNLKFIKEINFNLLPNSFTFNTQLKKYKNERKYRLPEEFDYRFFDQRFTWDRRYNLQWDLTKSLGLSFSADNLGVVDELRQVGLADNAEIVDERGEFRGKVGEVSEREIRDYTTNNIRNGGRTKSYSHNLNVNYNVPLKNIPILDFASLKAQYNADFYWEAASLNVDSLGNVIQNGQNRQVNLNFDFEKLYKKSGYLKKIEGGKSNARTAARSRARGRTTEKADSKDKDGKEEKKKEREVSVVEKAMIRPLLLLRDVKLTYKEDLSTTVPGFVNQTSILGMNPDFSSPGWDFVAGLQPNINPTNKSNWLYKGAEQGWFSESRFLNQQLNQTQQQNFEARIELEPFKDFEIDINFRKRYSQNHLEEFKNLGTPGNLDFQQLALNDIGSFEVTYFSLNTFFNDNYQDMFNNFQSSRAIISERLAVRAAERGVPDALEAHPDDPNYYQGLGRQSDQVLVPAFIANYTGISPNDVDLDYVEKISALKYIPAPNWDINYNGLSKLGMFKDIFSSFSIKHGYKSVMRVNNFNSDPVYNNLLIQDDPLAIYSELEQQSQNYYSRLEIPQLTISEQFAPLIGIDVKTKTDMNLNFEYRKSRELGMNFNGKELVNQNSEEIIFGFGYTFENIDIPFLTRSGGKKKSKSRKDDGKEKILQLGKSGKITDNRGQEMLVNVDFSFRDDETWNFNIDGEQLRTRGSTSVRINPSVEYDVSQTLALRLFFDYSKTIPKITSSYELTNMQGGITIRFKLN
ncbi:T9SS outer membrane translocon Sov/SprA [Portibacter lacus]|uniref:Cell surface protein SprA n=1 Tax=Portibacter lacus TaxID=1099794 RepID=A0AA37SP69_9BACT|nr:cell surface protein SprA [Portibacter lacus]GLR16897.1 cell surface protein SprA [Portibacter lacus]